MKAMILGSGKSARVRPIVCGISEQMTLLAPGPAMEDIVSLLKQHGKIVVGNKCIDPTDDAVIDIEATDIGFLLDDARNVTKPNATADQIAALLKASHRPFK